MAPPGKRAAHEAKPPQQPPARDAGTTVQNSHTSMKQHKTSSGADHPAAGSSAVKRPADSSRTLNRQQQAPLHTPPVGPINDASAAANGQPQRVAAPWRVSCGRPNAAVSSSDANMASGSVSGQPRHAPAEAALPGGRDWQNASSSSNHMPSAPACAPAPSSVSMQPAAVPMYGASVQGHHAGHANGVSPVRAAADEAQAKVKPKITWSNPLKRMPLALKNSPRQTTASDAGVAAEPGSPSGVAPMDIDSPAQQQHLAHIHQAGSAHQAGDARASGQEAAAAAPAAPAAQANMQADAAPTIPAERDTHSTGPVQRSQHQPASGNATCAEAADADGRQQGAHRADGRRDWEWGVPAADARHVRRVRRQAKAPSVKLEAGTAGPAEGTRDQHHPLPVLPDKLKVPGQSQQDSAPTGKGVKRKAESEPDDTIIDLTSSSEKDDASDGEDDPASPNDTAPNRSAVAGTPLKQNRCPPGPVRKAMRLAQLDAQRHVPAASHSGSHAAQQSQPPAPATGHGSSANMPSFQNAGMQGDQKHANVPTMAPQHPGRGSNSKVPQRSWNFSRLPNATAYTASIRPMSWHQQAENGHRFAHSGLAGSSRPAHKASSPLRRAHTGASLQAGPLQKKQRVAAPGQAQGQMPSKQGAGASGRHASTTVEPGGVRHMGSNAQPVSRAAAVGKQHSGPEDPSAMANGSSASQEHPVAQPQRHGPAVKAPGLSPLARQLSARHGSAKSEVNVHFCFDLMGRQAVRTGLVSPCSTCHNVLGSRPCWSSAPHGGAFHQASSDCWGSEHFAHALHGALQPLQSDINIRHAERAEGWLMRPLQSLVGGCSDTDLPLGTACGSNWKMPSFMRQGFSSGSDGCALAWMFHLKEGTDAMLAVVAQARPSPAKRTKAAVKAAWLSKNDSTGMAAEAGVAAPMPDAAAGSASASQCDAPQAAGQVGTRRTSDALASVLLTL